ncbi:MAG: hypothetical protein ACI9GK_003026 [Devosia sp.]|jgi:hypothetical protein
MSDARQKREPIPTRHTSVYNEFRARENEAFRAGIEHAIAVLALTDEPAAERIESLLFTDVARAQTFRTSTDCLCPSPM